MKIQNETWALDDDRLPESKDVKRTPPDDAFMESIKEVQLEPVGIGYNKTDGYFLMFGRMRLLALRDLFERGEVKNEIDVRIFNNISDGDAARYALIENAQRSDNPISDAIAIDNILKSDPSATYKTIAESIGKPVTYVKKTYEKYGKCLEWTLTAILEGKMAISTAFALGKLGKDTQEQLKKQFKKNGKLTGAEVHDSRRAMQVASYAELIPQSMYNMDVKRNEFTRAELEQVRSLEELKKLLG